MLALAAGLAVSAAASAGEPRAPERLLGERIAKAGLPQRGVPACNSCHGRHGEGSATAAFPRLASQAADYLAHQLHAFAEGKRPGAAMPPIARALDRTERVAVAQYFAGTQARALPVPAPMGGRGATLVFHGDEKLGVPACSSCHGWNGAGNPPDVPYLAGQHGSYLLKEFHAWRSGARDSDPRRQMPAIMQRLTDDDLAPLADYLAALPPPGPGPERARH